MKTHFLLSSIARLVAMVLLLWALAWHPYRYYTILRCVVCGVGAYSTFVAITSGKISWAWALGIAAVVFNPIIPVHLDRNTWAVIDIAVAILFGVSTFFVREHR